MDPKIIEHIAHQMVGDHVGWQARFADISGISRPHMANVMKGVRPVTVNLQVRIYKACSAQADALRRRAAVLSGYADNIEKQVPAIADADEAEAIINNLAFGAVEDSE